MCKYIRTEIQPGSELERLLLYKIAYLEVDGDNVPREVWVLPDGRIWRRSVEGDHKEAEGSLRDDVPDPDAKSSWRKLRLIVDWCSAQEFEDMWEKATWARTPAP
jgi:hypothetical protein